MNSNEYFPADLPENSGKGSAGGKIATDDLQPAGGDTTPAEDMPLVLAVELRAPAWAHQIVQYLQTRDLPEEQEEA